MNNNLIITIGREYGTGGREIGQKLALRLGIPFYDRELITRAAKKTGFDEKLFEQLDKRATNSFLYSLTMFGSVGLNGMSLTDQLYLAQSNVIREMAEESSCVIVGRCADYILQDKAKCLKVFIHADMAFRAKRIVEVYGEREQSPEQRLRDKDKRRAAYHRFYTNMKWGYAQNYHITLDSGELGIDKCADIIADLYKSRA